MSADPGYDPEFDDAVPKPAPGWGYRLGRLLVVLGIIAILIALLLPFRRGSGAAASRAVCASYLKQIALALHNYEQTYGALPPACTVDAQGKPLHSWRTLILPYLDQEELYRTIDLTKPWDDPANAKALATMPPVFHCPSASGPRNMTTYLASTAPGGCFLPREPRRLSDITDPLGATLLVIEVGEVEAVPWMAPRDADEPVVMGLGPNSKLDHAGGMNASLVDGHVQFLKASTPAKVRRSLISISGGDDVSADDW